MKGSKFPGDFLQPLWLLPFKTSFFVEKTVLAENASIIARLQIKIGTSQYRGNELPLKNSALG